MRETTKRLTACLLSAAMLLVCCISGLVLPTVADSDSSGNLLSGKVESSYTMKGGEADRVITASVDLKAGTRYAVRVTAKADAKATVTFPNVSTTSIAVAVTSEWRVYQSMFTMTSDVDTYTMKIKFSGTSAAQALTVKDIQLLVAPTDGTFNLIPGGTMDAQSSFMSEAFTKNLPLEADPDDPTNRVAHFDKANGSNYAFMWDVSGIDFSYGKVMKLVFRLKGGKLRLDCRDSAAVKLPNPDAVEVTGGGAYAYYQTAEWTECVYYVKPSQLRNSYVIGARAGSNAGTEMWLDDVQMYEITVSTGIKLDKQTLTMAPSGIEQLLVSGAPDNSYLMNDTFIWQSSDDSVIQVDQSGMVIAVGADGESATVTVTNGDGFTDSCVVTIDADASQGGPTSLNLLDGKVNASYTMAGGDSPLTLTAMALMRANTRYAVRVTAKATDTATVAFPGVTSSGMSILGHGEWRTYQVMFTPTSMLLNFKMQVTFAGKGTADSLEIKNIELLAAPADGTFNLLPASSADAETTFLSKAFAMGLERVTDPDDPTNTVLHFRSDNNSCAYWDMTGVNFTAGKIMKLTFKIKGGMIRIDCGDGSPVYMANPDAVKITNGGLHTYYQYDEWTEVSYYIKPSAVNQIPWFMISHRNLSAGLTEVWMDDLQMCEVTPASGLTLGQDTVAVAPANTKQLTVSATDENALIVNQVYTWTSSDESVVRVNANGLVTAVGDHGQSATVTVKNGDDMTASVVVTIDENEPGMPQVEEIVVTPGGAFLDIGGTAQLEVMGVPQGNIIGRVVWSTDNGALATVDQNGLVTAVGGDGVVTITATTQFGKTATATIHVSSQPNLLVNGDFEQDSSVSWRNTTALKDGIGMYGSRGYELCQNGETAVGTYYSRDILLKPATKYIVSYDYKVEKGGGFRLYAAELGAGNVKPSVFCERGALDTAEWQHVEQAFTTSDFYDAEAGWAMTWSTSASDNDGTGAVAYLDNLAIREYIGDVQADSFVIEQQDVQLAASRTTKLTLSASPADADMGGMVWTSSNENVAYVVSGHVIGVGAGTAVITATARNGKTATTTVTVTGIPAPLKNGSFETEEGWVLSGNVQYLAGGGLLRSNGIRLMPAEGNKAAGSFEQKLTGLQPDSAYQLHLQLRRSSNPNSYFNIKLLNSAREVIYETKGGGATGTVKYTSAFYKYDIITPADLDSNEDLFLVVEYAEGVAHFTFDNLILAEATSEVDLIVSDMFWNDDSPEQVTPGTPLSFSVVMVNQGAEDYVGSKPITVDILVDAKKVTTLSYTGQIQRGELYVLTSEVGSEWMATLGDHMITAQVNSSMTILEADDDNNYMTYNLRVAEQADFVQVPNEALKRGFNRLVFSDHFDSIATIDTRASGDHGYKWYITRPWGEANLTPDDYRVENGILYLTTEDTLWNYSLATIDAKHTGVGFSFNTGYMEIRVRMKQTADTGAVTGIRVPAVWALSTDTIWGTRPAGTASIELDWFEYWGNKYSTIRFDTTLHETRYGLDGTEIGKVTHGEKHEEPLGDYRWHTYAMSWSNGLLETYFDGTLIGTLKYSEDGYPDPLPSGSLNIEAGGADPHLGLWSALDQQNMPIILGGASDFPLEVDWVHVWQSDGTVEPQPDVDNTAPSFVYRYLTGNGKVYSELTVDNYQQILSGEAIYLSMTGEQQQAVDARIGTSYMAWIADIYNTIEKVENFISFYACDENGVPYGEANADNYAWIVSAQAEWDSFSDFARDLVDNTLAQYSLKSFTVLLEEALLFEARAPESPAVVKVYNLTLLWVAIGVVGGLIVGGGVVIAVLLFVKKRKKREV